MVAQTLITHFKNILADGRYLFCCAGDQALVKPQSLPLGEALRLVVSNQSTLDLRDQKNQT